MKEYFIFQNLILCKFWLLSFVILQKIKSNFFCKIFPIHKEQIKLNSLSGENNWLWSLNLIVFTSPGPCEVLRTLCLGCRLLHLCPLDFYISIFYRKTNLEQKGASMVLNIVHDFGFIELFKMVVGANYAFLIGRNFKFFFLETTCVIKL